MTDPQTAPPTAPLNAHPTDPLIVPAGERGVVRVFALQIEAGGIQALRAPGAMGAALGAPGIDADYVEAFPLTDLAGVGLAAYLTDGCGVPEAVIAPEAARLDALDGSVMVVLSRAFGGKTTQLHPSVQLELVGVYAETPVDWSSNGPIETASARPGMAPAPQTAPARPSRLAASVIAGLIALAALLFFLVF